MKLIAVLAAASFTALSLAQQFAPSIGTSSSTNLIKNIRIEQKLGAQVPANALFKERDGTPIDFGQIASSRPLLVLPVFYRCRGVCSVEFQNLMTLLSKDKQLQVGKDFDFVVLGIDPQEGPDLAQQKFQDTDKQFPGLLKGGGWHFLTGDYQNIRSVTDALGFYYTYDAKSDVINHPSGIMFVSPGGKVSSYILGPTYTADNVAKDIQLAKKSEVGAKVQDVFFGCVHIDPLTGQRSLVIEKVLRLFGVVFLAVAGCGIYLLSRKKKPQLSTPST